MRTNFFFKTVTALLLLTLLLGCRNESIVINENTQNQRAKEFFNNTIFNHSKTSKINQQNQFFEILKKIDIQQDFLSKISDKKGLPSWQFAFSKKFSTSSSSKTTDSEIIYIPLKESDKNYLSSILFVKNPNSQKPEIFSITNNELLKYIKNDKIDLKDRENLLLTFLSIDNQIFGDRKYNNIPLVLFKNIETNKKSKSFSLKQGNNVKNNQNTQARYVLDCVTIYHCAGCYGSCDLCNDCVSTHCSYVWSDGGGYTGSISGDSSGTGDTGQTGGGGSSSGTTSSTPWYLMNPRACLKIKLEKFV